MEKPCTRRRDVGNDPGHTEDMSLPGELIIALYGLRINQSDTLIMTKKKKRVKIITWSTVARTAKVDQG